MNVVKHIFFYLKNKKKKMMSKIRVSLIDSQCIFSNKILINMIYVSHKIAH